MQLYNASYASAVGNQTGYHGLASRIRLKTFLKAMQPNSNDHILEIGCNTGVLLNAIRQKAKATGVDVNSEALAQSKLPDTHIMDATKLSFADNSFTKVCAFEVIEHIEDYSKSISEAHRVLQEEGYLYLSFPWELFRGQAAIGDSIRAYKHPFNAGNLHIHKLTPGTIKNAASELFDVVHHALVWIPCPSYLMILQKKRGNNACQV